MQVDEPTLSALVQKSTAVSTITWFRDCLTGVNGQTLKTLPTPLAEQVLDLAIMPGRRKVTGSDLEEAGLTSVPGTVDAQQLQREVFRSGPFYAQWFERWRNGENRPSSVPTLSPFRLSGELVALPVL